MPIVANIVGGLFVVFVPLAVVVAILQIALTVRIREQRRVRIALRIGILVPLIYTMTLVVVFLVATIRARSIQRSVDSAFLAGTEFVETTRRSASQRLL